MLTVDLFVTCHIRKVSDVMGIHPQHIHGPHTSCSPNNDPVLTTWWLLLFFELAGLSLRTVLCQANLYGSRVRRPLTIHPHRYHPLIHPCYRTDLLANVPTLPYY